MYFSKKPIKISPQSIYSKTTLYNYINVFEFEKNGKVIRGLNSRQSSILRNCKPDEYIVSYYDRFKDFFVLKKKKKNILVLGNAAGASLSGLLYWCDKNKVSDINFDVVEIDKEFVKIGQDYFSLPEKDIRLHYFFEDARTFLNNERTNKYDIVYYDIYNSGNILFPYYLVTKETFEHIYNDMDNSGILVMNIIGSLKKNTKGNNYLRQIYTQLKTIFPQVLLYEARDDLNNLSGNYSFAAFKNTNDENIKEIQRILSDKNIREIEETNEIFTDKYSPVEKFL